jgi:HK97 family phage major capsid protein/HK97 family phage prohead protease
MDRAYGVLELRSVDEEHRIVEGIANTIALDDYGTVIDPQGARFTLPIPLLWQHQMDSPVGEVTFAQVSPTEIRVRAQIRRIDEPGPFKDLTDRAWQGVKHQLVRGFSIGFKPLKQKANRFTEWSWRELSLVTIPANQQATIDLVRSLDRAALAASGERLQPGVSGAATTNPKRTMTIKEQIQAHENSRAAKVARQQSLMEGAETRGETLAENEAEEFDTLAEEIRSIDGHLSRLNTLKRANDSAAVPVNGGNMAAASESRGSEPVATNTRGVPVVRVRANTEPGIGMARAAMALLRNRGDVSEAEADLRRTYPDQADELKLLLRAPVAPATSTHGTWAGPLVQPTTLANEFLEFLRPRTLIGRIPGLRSVDFNSRVLAQTGTGTYNWVGEGKPKPLTALALNAVQLAFNKIAGIIVLTEETIKYSTPSAERITRDDMIAGIASFMDNQFLDPTITAIAGVRPASITDGVAGTAASGTTEAAARADIRALLGGFIGSNIGLNGVVLLANPSVAFNLGTMVNALGQPAFPGLGIEGGNLLGVPVITSNATALGSQIVAVHAPSILIADDGSVQIDMSREASLEMESAPADPPTATTVLVSLYQHNLVGLRAERSVTWLRARAGSVRRITGVAYA